MGMLKSLSSTKSQSLIWGNRWAQSIGAWCNRFKQSHVIRTASLSFSAKNKDSLIADLRCHYTDSRGLYYVNILAGSFTTYMSSYECATCRDYSLEQLSDMSAKNCLYGPPSPTTCSPLKMTWNAKNGADPWGLVVLNKLISILSICCFAL